MVLVYGHRGARARRPENTLPAFAYAIALGVDAIEMDLAVTRDDSVVISHDPILDPPICAGPRKSAVIRSLTLAEVRQWDCGAAPNPDFPAQLAIPGTRMPALDDVFELAPRGAFGYSLEIKSFPERPEYAPPPAEFTRLVWEKIRQYKLEKRTLVQSFDFRTLAAMRKLAPQIRLAALVENDARDFAAIAAEASHAEIAAPEFHLVTPKKVDAAHRSGLQVIAWTANTPADWDMLIQAGVDGIITDDPAELLAYLKNSR
jgi:glycerophosphoryl diester phosphodiesterase